MLTLLATGVVAAVPAPASAALRTFRSPTGNLGCMFYSDAADAAAGPLRMARR